LTAAVLVNVAGPASATTSIWIGRAIVAGHTEAWESVAAEITYVCEPGQANALWVEVESEWFKSPEGQPARMKDEGLGQVTCDGESRQVKVSVPLSYDYGEGLNSGRALDGDGIELAAHYNDGHEVEITAAFADLPPDAEDVSQVEIHEDTTENRTLTLE
jgi:hypothetical protein